MQFFHMPKELVSFSDQVLSHWFPTGKSSHASVGKKIGRWRRRGRGGPQPNTNVIQPGIIVSGKSEYKVIKLPFRLKTLYLASSGERALIKVRRFYG